MVKMDVKSDAIALAQSLDALKSGLGERAIPKMLRALATSTKKYVKRRMGQYLHLNANTDQEGNAVSVRTGKQGHVLKGGDTGSGLQGAVYGFRRSSTHAVVASGMGWMAEPLERGATIRPTKSNGYLTFRGAHGWCRKKSVTLPAKHWFTKSSEGFEDTPDYIATIDKVLGKEIKRAGLS